MQTQGWTSSGRLAILRCETRNRLMRVYDLSRSTCRFKNRSFARAISNVMLRHDLPFSVKAGGMRITQHKTPKDERETKSSKDIEESKPSSR